MLWKLRYFLTFYIFVSILFMAGNITLAQWEAISSGYAITTDYHGMIVPPGASVTATAGTTDPNVTSVTFLWKDLNETVKYEINAAVWSNGSTYDGKTIYYADSSYMPDIIGDWGVQALFLGEGGTVKANHADVVRIRASSFNVVPDLPVIGTAGAITAMFLGLFLYVKRKQP